MRAAVEHGLRGDYDGWTTSHTDWLDGTDFNPELVAAMLAGFEEVFTALATAPLDDPERLAEVFDTIEFLPMELMRAGPAFVIQYLSGSELPEVAPLRERLAEVIGAERT